MSAVEQRALRVLEAIPAVFSGEDALPNLLDTIKEAASSPHCLLAERDKTGRLQFDAVSPEHPCIRGYGDATHIESYFTRYRPFDDWERVRAVPGSDTPIIYSGQPDGILPRSSPIREWFEPIDINDNAYIRLCSSPLGSLGLNLHFDHGIADRDEIAKLLGLIQRPLGKTLSVLMRAETLPLTGKSCPEFVLDETGRLILHNEAADRFLIENDSMLAANGTVRALQQSENKRLQAAIGAARMNCDASVIQLRSATTDESVLVAVLPITRAPVLGLGTQARVKIRILCHDQSYDDVIDEIGEAYDLTPLQHVILRYIMRGFRAHEIATLLERNNDYIREQLSRMYAIFDVKHQGALCAKVAQFAAARMSG